MLSEGKERQGCLVLLIIISLMYRGYEGLVVRKNLVLTDVGIRNQNFEGGAV